MLLDASTIRDLEVLSTAEPRGTSLWSLVDRTRSRAGALALRQRLLTGPEDAAGILARQTAHRALAADVTWPTRLARANPDGVEAYLATSWQLPSSMPTLAPVRPWYRHYLRDVAQGRACVVGLLAAATEIAARLTTSDAVVLRDQGDAIAVVLRDLEAHGLGVHGGPSGRGFDRIARGQAAELLRKLTRVIGDIEAMWSIGAATLEHGWVYPEPSTHFRVTGLVHPALTGAVPSDLALDDAVRLCFVTGPNMAGKSTFMKAMALAVALAHVGCGVPATCMSFRVTGGVFASLNVADRLATGESFYLAEVRRIAALAGLLLERGAVFAVLDEPFRGTNVHDAMEATREVLSRLAKHPGALVFVSSHLSELAPQLGTTDSVTLLHFASDVTAGPPRFDYRLREGVSTQRLGMTLLRQERVIETLDASVAAAAGHGRPTSVDTRHDDGGPLGRARSPSGPSLPITRGGTP
ncbi:MutS-related protein [Luteitalea sp.]